MVLKCLKRGELTVNIFDQYGIKEVADVTLYSIHKKKDGSGDVYYVPALYLDTLKISTIEKTAESTWAQGGVGNARLINWDYGKQINVSLEDALCTPASLGMCWNGTLSADWKDGQVDIATEVCYCKNPVTKVSRMEKAIFPRDTRTQNTVSELLPRLADDEVDKNMDILKKSSVVDGTKISGNGIVRGHTYRWKMAVESGVMSIAQVPDRFFDIKGVSYPIDWNRKVSVTSLPDYENYKDAIIYKINSFQDVETPKAKIIFDDSMEGINTALINSLKRIYGYDNITVRDLVFQLKKADVNEDADVFTLAKAITYVDPDTNQLYLFSEENMYNQFQELGKHILASVTEAEDIYHNVNIMTNIANNKDLFNFCDFNIFYPISTDANDGLSHDGQFTLNTPVPDKRYLNSLDDTEIEIAQLKALYGETAIITQDFTVDVPKEVVGGTYVYPADPQDQLTFEFKDVIFLCDDNEEEIGLLVNDNFFRQYENFIRFASQEVVSGGQIDAFVLGYIKREGSKLRESIGNFFEYTDRPLLVSKGLYTQEIISDKYSAYLNNQADKVRSVYAQNRAMTSLFAANGNNSLIPDELGSVNRTIIQHRPIEKADYLAIIVDNNDDYYALIGIDASSHDQYNNIDFDDNFTPITWYQPETDIDISQFKGLDMWIRFHSINEMIYFLITKYENDIIDIIPSTIYANENDKSYGDGGGYWAVNKQKTTVERNNDQESVLKQGKLWAYVNPRTMMPYNDDYWFHNGEPLYVKSLTLAPAEKRIKGNKIVVRADEWPGMYMMVGETFIRDKDTGTDERLQIRIPLCKVKSDHTITLQADGDPTTFNLNLEVARPASGAMMEITAYEVAKKMIEGDDGCFYAADGATEVLSE